MWSILHAFGLSVSYNNILRDMLEKYVIAYIVNILIYSPYYKTRVLLPPGCPARTSCITIVPQE